MTAGGVVLPLAPQVYAVFWIIRWQDTPPAEAIGIEWSVAHGAAPANAGTVVLAAFSPLSLSLSLQWAVWMEGDGANVDIAMHVALIGGAPAAI